MRFLSLWPYCSMGRLEGLDVRGRFGIGGLSLDYLPGWFTGIVAARRNESQWGRRENGRAQPWPPEGGRYEGKTRKPWGRFETCPYGGKAHPSRQAFRASRQMQGKARWPPEGGRYEGKAAGEGKPHRQECLCHEGKAAGEAKGAQARVPVPRRQGGRRSKRRTGKNACATKARRQEKESRTGKNACATKSGGVAVYTRKYPSTLDPRKKRVL